MNTLALVEAPRDVLGMALDGARLAAQSACERWLRDGGDLGDLLDAALSDYERRLRGGRG